VYNMCKWCLRPSSEVRGIIGKQVSFKEQSCTAPATVNECELYISSLPKLRSHVKCEYLLSL